MEKSVNGSGKAWKTLGIFSTTMWPLFLYIHPYLPLHADGLTTRLLRSRSLASLFKRWSRSKRVDGQHDELLTFATIAVDNKGRRWGNYGAVCWCVSVKVLRWLNVDAESCLSRLESTLSTGNSVSSTSTDSSSDVLQQLQTACDELHCAAEVMLCTRVCLCQIIQQSSQLYPVCCVIYGYINNNNDNNEPICIAP